MKRIPKECCNFNCKNIFFVEEHKLHLPLRCETCTEKNDMGIIEVIVELSELDIVTKDKEVYVIKWHDGSNKVVQSLTIAFSARTMADAIFLVNKLFTFNINAKSFNIKRR